MIALLALAFGAQVQAGIPAWTLSPTPTVTIEDDGTPAKEFVRIVGVARLSGGRIAVANRGTNDIRIFDARGRHLTTFGRTGEGPGEFRRIEFVSRSGDTTWFYDSGLRRTTAVLIGAEPKLLGSTRITADGKRESFTVNGRLPDGRYMVTTNVSPTFDGPPGVRRLPGSVGIVARTGDGSVHWLGDFKSASIFAYSPTSDLKDGSVGPIAFSPWLRSATGSGLIWIGDSAGDSVVVVRARDLSRFTIRLPIVSRAPSRALVDAERKRELGANSGANFFGEAKYSAKYLPERLPYFGSLTPGPQGEIWVQAFATDAAGPVQYVVIDSTGRPKGQVAVPGGSRIREVGLDYVLIVHTNEDDVESVRLHRLDRVRD